MPKASIRPTKPPRRPRASAPQTVAIPPEDQAPIPVLVADVVPDSAVWLATPNSAFGGRRPGDFIETDEEPYLRQIVLAYKYGVYS